MHIRELTRYLDELLSPCLFRDYCPNGLQVAGDENIHKIVTGVSASQALIDAAIEAKADTLLVHHGFFWRGEDPRIIGQKRKRLAALLQHGINLIAYHLPLDAHAEFGNNVQLAKLMDIAVQGEFADQQGPALGRYGQLLSSMSGEEFSIHLETKLGRKPLHISGRDREIKTVAWCSGAAQDLLSEAAELGVDAYFTGEISERTVHEARELGIHFYAAGHHATERYGVAALGKHLQQQFGLEHQFIDIPNPV